MSSFPPHLSFMSKENVQKKLTLSYCVFLPFKKDFKVRMTSNHKKNKIFKVLHKQGMIYELKTRQIL